MVIDLTDVFDNYLVDANITQDSCARVYKLLSRIHDKTPPHIGHRLLNHIRMAGCLELLNSNVAQATAEFSSSRAEWSIRVWQDVSSPNWDTYNMHIGTTECAEDGDIKDYVASLLQPVVYLITHPEVVNSALDAANVFDAAQTKATAAAYSWIAKKECGICLL